MPKNNQEGRQYGFFVSADGAELHTRPKAGDEMIQPKKKKEKKPKKRTPYGEVMHLYAVLRKRAAILDGFGMYEDLNGNVHLNRGGVWTEVSLEESTGILKRVSDKHPDFPEIPVLSEKAQSLKYALEHKKDQKPPLTDHLSPHPAKDPFGKPLK